MKRHARRLAVVLVALALAACAGPPLVIAHRGASLERLEHTVEAYRLAHAQGADVIEPDVVMTRDGELVCSHDLTVTADVVGFDERRDAEGRLFLADLDLAEVLSLERPDPRHAEPARFVSFDDFLDLVDELDATADRTTIVIPEPKRPDAHRARGLDVVGAVVEALAARGLTDRDDLVILQCFDHDELRALRDDGCDLRLVALLYEPIDAAALDELATWADGIGPSRRLIEPDDGRPADDLVRAAHRRGLEVFPYTFADDVDAMRRFFDVHGVDGLFTDAPAAGRVAARR